MTTMTDGKQIHMELSDPNELFEVRSGTIFCCVDSECEGSIAGEIHGEFWLAQTTLYRQWMNCSCETCDRQWIELIEVYDEPSQRYVLQDHITIRDDRLEGIHRLPGFGASIAGLIQGSQKDGIDPGVIMQETINALMHRSRRRYLEA